MHTRALSKTLDRIAIPKEIEKSLSLSPKQREGKRKADEEAKRKRKKERKKLFCLPDGKSFTIIGEANAWW